MIPSFALGRAQEILYVIHELYEKGLVPPMPVYVDSPILIVGFMAQHTLGRRILELSQAYEAKGRKGEAPLVKILGKEYPLKARVVRLGGFSAHADKNEMMRFLKQSNLKIK